MQNPSVFPLSTVSCHPSEPVVVGCLVRDFLPLPATVTWSPSDDSVRNYTPVFGSNGLYTMSSQLGADKCKDKAMCRVEHNGKTQTVEVPCIIEPLPCDPRVTLYKPALEDLLLGFKANLTCTLTGVRNPEQATFSWSPSSGMTVVKGEVQENSCGCFSVSSYLSDVTDLWNRGQSFSCTVNHPNLKKPLTTTISKTQGTTIPPQVHLLPPPSEEVGLEELVTLTCLVRGYKPEDVVVLWLHGNQQLPRENFMTWSSEPEPHDAGTFAVTSVLRVDAQTWKKGDSFSCMVGHEGLPLNFTQKTIDRLAGKPTHVNVSVIMAEADGVCY